MRRNYAFLAIFCGLAMAVLFLAIHLFTLYIAYPGGAGQMLLTLLLPVAAQIYWIFHIAHLTGTFLNALTVLCLVWVVLAISTFALSRASRETA